MRNDRPRVLAEQGCSWSAHGWRPATWQVFRADSSTPGDIKRWHRATVLTVLVFLFMQVTAGVLRWVFDMFGVAVLAYVPQLMMLACIAYLGMRDLADGRLKLGTLLAVVVLAISMVIGWYNTSGAQQVVFGLWILLPFFFGMVSAPLWLRPGRRGVLLSGVVFVVCVGGVLLHSVVAYPWVGLSYSIGQVELEGAREWHVSGGQQRLSGLARSSFDVAGQILMLATLLTIQIKQGWGRGLIWLVACAGIALSTSKGVVLALLMAAFAVEALQRRWPVLMYGILAFGIVWVMLPPLLGWSLDWGELARTDIDNPLYGSFIDRMNDMWPRAWDLATVQGFPPLGRGMGGIGSALSIFEPDLANAGDNVFVYLWVVVGVLAIPMWLAVQQGLFRLVSRAPLGSPAAMALALSPAVMGYGGVSNIFEHAMLAAGMGGIVRVLLQQARRQDRVG
jgi:hypothetical protein